MQFAYTNLPVVAAAMILSGHMKVDLECLDEADSLLITDSSCFIKCETHPNDEGAYLYFDLVRRVFVRSGKVAGRGYVVRGDEHLKGAKESIPTSPFYRRYPSKLSERAAKCVRKGHFENLLQVVAAGFDPTSELLDYLEKDYNDGGVLILSDTSLVYNSLIVITITG